MRIRFGVCLVVLACAASGEELALHVDAARSSVGFELGGNLHTTHGTFGIKSGDVTVDTATGKASGQVLVDVASGQSWNGARDRRMHAEILESAKYPRAVFLIDQVEGKIADQGESQVRIHGSFEIHGAKHELTAPGTVRREGGKLRVETKFAVPYVKWGMKNPSNFLFKVSDTVELDIVLEGA